LQIELVWQYQCQATMGSKRSLSASALEMLAEVSHTHEPRSDNGEVASTASGVAKFQPNGTLWSLTFSFALDEQ